MDILDFEQHSPTALIIYFPASVKPRLRVLRLSSLTCSSSSSLATVWLMEETLIWSWRAAAVNEPNSTTLAKTDMRFNRSIIHSGLKVI
jgi:hypothetical protein